MSSAFAVLTFVSLVLPKDACTLPPFAIEPQVYAADKCYMFDTSNNDPKFWKILKSMLEEQRDRILYQNARQLVGLLYSKDFKLKTSWQVEVFVELMCATLLLCSSIHKTSWLHAKRICVRSSTATCASIMAGLCCEQKHVEYQSQLQA